MDTYGWILFGQKKYGDAEIWLQRAAEGSRNGNILDHYGDALFRNGKVQAAIEAWKAAKQSGNSDPGLEKKIQCKCLDVK